MRAPSVVAVIDDDSAVRTAIAALVASKGYQVEVYASAEEFIAHVARSEAACLVVECSLVTFLVLNSAATSLRSATHFR